MSTPSFAQLGVPPELVASLDARGIAEPFPIQVATIPDGLAGRDICGRAPTGSGKTIAFGIPLVTRVSKAQPRRPRALVLVPTRELAAQVQVELSALAGRGGPTVESIYGGVGFDRQIKAMRRGVDIVVACPGRLVDLIEQRHVILDEIEMVVLDEADRMADMGFLPVVRRLLDQCPKDRQTVLFSATLDGDVDQLISKYQRDPVRHEEEGEEEDGSGAEHYFWKVDKTLRLQTTASVVDRIGPTVVFCRTKRGADRVARQLAAAGVTAAAIHGDRSQGQRERALKSFHDGRVAALVATDVAARGIHVDGVAGVVHFDPPADHKDYVHRSGRTARAGAQGVVVSLVTPDLRSAVGTIQRQLGLPVGLETIELGVLTEGERPSRPKPTMPTTDDAGRSHGSNSGNGERRGSETRPSSDENARRRRRRPSGERRDGAATRVANAPGRSGGRAAGSGGNAPSRKPAAQGAGAKPGAKPSSGGHRKGPSGPGSQAKRSGGSRPPGGGRSRRTR